MRSGSHMLFKAGTALGIMNLNDAFIIFLFKVKSKDLTHPLSTWDVRVRTGTRILISPILTLAAPLHQSMTVRVAQFAVRSDTFPKVMDPPTLPLFPT